MILAPGLFELRTAGKDFSNELAYFFQQQDFEILKVTDNRVYLKTPPEGAEISLDEWDLSGGFFPITKIPSSVGPILVATGAAALLFLLAKK